MTSTELKELVKQHFSLTEAPSKQSFGEIMDENKAFTLIFEGDTLEVGKEVKVRTTDGQELSAPDGEHRLEDGSIIKTEGGKVVEYLSPADVEAREGAELAVDGVEQPDEEESTIVEQMAEVEVEVEDEAETMEEEMPSMVEEVAKAVIEAVKDEVDAMKAELAELKAKMAEMGDEPATEKAMPSMMSSDKRIKPTADVFNSARFNAVMDRFSKK